MTTAVKALTPVAQLCPECGCMLAVVRGNPRRETYVTYVETLADWKAGAVVNCRCGAEVFCKPHLELPQ